MERVFLNPDHSSQLLVQISELWRREKFCDAALNLTGAKYKLHKLVLMAACPDILMILAHTEEGNLFDFYLPRDVEHFAVQAILGYFYDGAIQLKEGTIGGVEKLSELLQISQLIQYCREFRSLMAAKNGAQNQCSDQVQEQGETIASAEVPDSTTCGGIGGDGQNRVKEESGVSTSSQLNLSQRKPKTPQTSVVIKSEPTESPSENTSPFKNSKIAVVSHSQQPTMLKALIPTNLVCPGLNMHSDNDANIVNVSDYSVENSAATSNITGMPGISRSFSSHVSSPNPQSNKTSRRSVGARSSHELSINSCGNNMLVSLTVEPIMPVLSPGIAKISKEHGYNNVNPGVREMSQTTGSSQKQVITKMSPQEKGWTIQGETVCEQLSAKLNKNQGSSKDAVPFYSQDCVNIDHVVSSVDSIESEINDSIDPTNNEDNEMFVLSNPQERMVKPGLRSHVFSDNEVPSHITIPAIQPHYISTSQLSSPVSGASELHSVMQKAEQIMMEIIDSQSPPPSNRIEVMTHKNPRGTHSVPRLESRSLSNKELPAHSGTQRLEESNTVFSNSVSLSLPGPSNIQKTAMLMSKQNAQDQVDVEGPSANKKAKISLDPEHIQVEDLDGQKKAKTRMSIPRRNLPAEDKLKILESLEQIGLAATEKKFKVRESTIRGWRNKKDELIELSKKSMKRNRSRPPKLISLDSVLKKWIAEEYKSKGEKINRDEVCSKAVGIAKECGIQHFSASQSWFRNFYAKFKTELETFISMKRPVSNDKRLNRKSYTRDFKLEVIEYAEKHRNYKAEKKFGVSESTIRDWIKRKSKLEKMDQHLKRCREGKPEYVELEQKVRDWVVLNQQNLKRKLTTVEIRNKACEFAVLMKVDSFRGRSNWYSAFIRRHKIDLEALRQKKQDSISEESKTKGASPCKSKDVEKPSPESRCMQPSKYRKNVQKDFESESKTYSGAGDDDFRSDVGGMSEVYSRPHENSKKMSRFGRQFKPRKFDNSLVGDELSSELSDDENDLIDDEAKAKKMQFEKEEEMLMLSDFDNGWEPTDSSEDTDEEEEKN